MLRLPPPHTPPQLSLQLLDSCCTLLCSLYASSNPCSTGYVLPLGDESALKSPFLAFWECRAGGDIGKTSTVVLIQGAFLLQSWV